MDEHLVLQVEVSKLRRSVRLAPSKEMGFLRAVQAWHRAKQIAQHRRAASRAAEDEEWVSHLLNAPFRANSSE